MKSEPAPPADIDEYIAGYRQEIQPLLEKVRATIRRAAPLAEEKISYGIPTFTMHGNLVHFGGFKSHFGFFPTSSGIAHFKKELADYKTARGTAQFPYDKPIPHPLIAKIVKFRVKENLARAEAKKKQK